MSTSDQSGGLCLGEAARWDISGVTEFEPFFRHLGALLPESGAVVYVEGVAVAPDVRHFLEQHSIAPWHDVARGTLWPRPSTFHLPASPEILSALADLASKHAYPEIADHCHVYTKLEMILQWFDACETDCPLGVGPSVPEAKVRAFCALARATYAQHGTATPRPGREAFIAYWRDYGTSRWRQLLPYVLYLGGLGLFALVVRRIDTQGRFWPASLAVAVGYLILFPYLSIRRVHRRFARFIRCPRCGDWFGRDASGAYFGPNPKLRSVIGTGRCGKCGEQILSDL
jgi:hypothetical protein